MTSFVVRDARGNEYPVNGKNEATVPVQVGKNYIDVISTATDGNTTASLTYRVNVHVRQPEAIYYNEPYRDQYHFSVKDGWGNDPNGLVYYKGTYHFFYQFYDDTKWGPPCSPAASWRTQTTSLGSSTNPAAVLWRSLHATATVSASSSPIARMRARLGKRTTRSLRTGQTTR